MAERISTRTFCNGIAPGTFSTELSRCTTYAEIVNSGTIAIVPEPALSYADTKRCTAEDDLMAAGTDVTVHIKNNSSNAATTAGKITLYITGTNGAVYGSSISNLTSAPNVQTVTLSTADEQTITVKVDSNQWISFGFSSPAKKYCQRCYNITPEDTGGLLQITPWSTGIYYEPMTWSNATETNYNSNYNLYSYYVNDLTQDVYIFLAQKSQVKTSQNIYIKQISKGTGGFLVGTLTAVTMQNIKVKGVTYMTSKTELAPFYAVGNEYLVASLPLTEGSAGSSGGNILIDRTPLVDLTEASGTMTLTSTRPNGTALNSTVNCTFFFDSECTDQTYSPLLIGGGGNLDIEDIYLELYATDGIAITFKSIKFDTTSLGQWVKDTAYNPDSTTYTCYKSNSNKGTASSLSKARITFQGYSSITFYIKSYAQRYYDYCVLSKHNTALPTYSTTNYPTGSSATVPTTYIKSNTKNMTATSSYSPVGTYWTAVDYTGLDSSTQYYIEVGYCKNASTNSYEDRGFILLPIPDTSNPPASTNRDIYIYFCYKHYTFYRIKFDFQGGYVYLCKSDNSIINDTAILALEYTINDLSTYFDPKTGNYSSDYGKMNAKCLWTNQSSDSYSINMQYDILTSVTGNNSYQWAAGYDCTPRRLSYAKLTKATYGKDGGLVSLGNEIWYVIISIDGGLTIL